MSRESRMSPVPRAEPALLIPSPRTHASPGGSALAASTVTRLVAAAGVAEPGQVGDVASRIGRAVEGAAIAVASLSCWQQWPVRARGARGRGACTDKRAAVELAPKQEQARDEAGSAESAEADAGAAVAAGGHGPCTAVALAVRHVAPVQAIRPMAATWANLERLTVMGRGRAQVPPHPTTPGASRRAEGRHREGRPASPSLEAVDPLDAAGWR